MLTNVATAVPVLVTCCCGWNFHTLLRKSRITPSVSCGDVVGLRAANDALAPTRTGLKPAVGLPSHGAGVPLALGVPGLVEV